MKKKNLFVLLTCAVLGFSLAACNNNTSSSAAGGTPTPVATNSVITSPGASTPALVDEITGDSTSRLSAFNSDPNTVRTFYGKLMIKESFEAGGTVNLMFGDGSVVYRAVNVPSATAETYTIGNVYKITGTQRNIGVNYDTSFAGVEVPNGSTKISADYLDLSADPTLSTDNYNFVKVTKGYVTEKTEDSLSIITGTSNTVYKFTTRGINEAAVKAKFGTASVNQEVTITEAYSTYQATIAGKNFNVLSAEAITLGTVVERFIGEIAHDSSETGQATGQDLTVDVKGNEITFGGTGEYIEYYAEDQAKWGAAGNILGITITAPSNAVLAETKVKIGSGAEANWSDVAANAADTSATVYLNVTPDILTTPIGIDVTWKAETETQKFVVKVEEGTQFARYVNGSIAADAAIDGRPTGTVSSTDTLTVNKDGDTITYGQTGENIAYYEADAPSGRAAGNYVAVVITKPATGSVEAEISMKIGDDEPISWPTGASTYTYYWNVTAVNVSKDIVVAWASSTGNYYYGTQTFTVKIAAGVKLVGRYSGSIAADQVSTNNNLPTGSVDGTAIAVDINGDEITFGSTGGYIEWYAADQNAAKGNRICVVISKPDGFGAVDPKYYINGDATDIKTWSDNDANDKIYWYIVVSDIKDVYTLTVNWNGEDTDPSAQTFTVKIADGTKLVTEFARSAPLEKTIADFAGGTLTENAVLYKVTGIVQTSNNGSNANGLLLDEATGQTITYFNVTNDKTCFYEFDGTGSFTQGSTKDKQTVGDKITIIGIYLYYSTDYTQAHEIIGYIDSKVDKANVEYTPEIKINDPTKGTATLNQPTYKAGDTASLTIATTENDYLVKSLKINGTEEEISLKGETITFTIAITHNVIEVEFVDNSPITVSLPTITNATASLDGAGTENNLYSAGDTAKLTVKADTGYSILSVLHNNVALTADTTTTPGSSVYTFVVDFENDIEINIRQDGVTVEKTMTLTTSNLTGLAPTNAAGSGTATVDGVGFEWTDAYNYRGAIFIKKSSYFYNTTSLGIIKSIKYTYNNGGSDSAEQTMRLAASSMSEGTSGATHTFTQVTNSTGGTSYTYECEAYASGFFRLDVSSKNMQLTEIVITYIA